jgi:hypothetical protein
VAQVLESWEEPDSFLSNAQSKFGLLFSEVGAVFFVFLAGVLQDVAIRYQNFSRLYGERFGVHFGIVDGQLQIQLLVDQPQTSPSRKRIVISRAGAKSGGIGYRYSGIG